MTSLNSLKYLLCWYRNQRTGTNDRSNIMIMALAYTVGVRLLQRWLSTIRTYLDQHLKVVSYLSAESPTITSPIVSPSMAQQFYSIVGNWLGSLSWSHFYAGACSHGCQVWYSWSSTPALERSRSSSSAPPRTTRDLVENWRDKLKNEGNQNLNLKADWLICWNVLWKEDFYTTARLNSKAYLVSDEMLLRVTLKLSS